MSYSVHPNVRLGKNPTIGEFVVIGILPGGISRGFRETVIGDDAVIRSHTVIYAGNTIGRRFRTGHGVLVREDNVIGDDVSVGSHSVVEHHVRIGDGVRIHSQAFVPEYSELRKGCWLGPHVVLTNAKYPLSRDSKAHLRGPVIAEGAKIGANATVLPGIQIGEHAIVGAGAVVTKNVPAGKVVAGNPARVLKEVAALAAYDLRGD